MQDTEFDSILQILENPIRRRIIKRLSHGPSYPLQLSKELGLGQPLVARHLALMEKAGVVSSSMEESKGAPDRRSYSLAKSVSLTLDMAPNLFVQRSFAFETTKGMALSEVANSLLTDAAKISGEDEKSISHVSRVLDEVDKRLDKIEEERAALLYIRNVAMKTASEAIKRMEGEDKKRVVYSILEEHSREVEDLSESLDLRESVVRGILKELRQVLA